MNDLLASAQALANGTDLPDSQPHLDRYFENTTELHLYRILAQVIIVVDPDIHDMRLQAYGDPETLDSFELDYSEKRTRLTIEGTLPELLDDTSYPGISPGAKFGPGGYARILGKQLNTALDFNRLITLVITVRPDLKRLLVHESFYGAIGVRGRFTEPPKLDVSPKHGSIHIQ